MLLIIIFSITFAFGFSIAGMLLNNAIKNQPFYRKLSHYNFVKNEAINKYLGVLLFRKIIVSSFWRHLNPAVKITGRASLSKLVALRNEMTHAEISHLIAFICTLIVAILIRSKKHLYHDAFVPIIVCNIIFHVYPPLVQQYNKRRLDKVIKRISR